MTDPRQRSALLARQLPDLRVPLHAIKHPIIEAARLRYESAGPTNRDWYRSVRDHPWVECRHGDRWRGLVLWHPTSQCWLGYAGWHEQDSVHDVWARFTSACTFGTRIDSSGFLPTHLDHKRLEGERRQAARDAEHQAFRVTVVRCLLDAIENSGRERTTSLPDGSDLRVLLREDGDVDELRLRIVVNWRGGEGAPVVERVKDAVPGIAHAEWDVIAPRPDEMDPAVMTYVDSRWVARVTAAAAEHGIDALGSNPNLVLDPSDGQAHIVVGRSTVSAAYVEGDVVRSVCGRRFVPRLDPAMAPECPTCHDTRAALQARAAEG